MGKNQKSVVVLWIWLKFWCMIPMGVKYNHTKFEQKTQRWRERDSQVADLSFKTCSLGPKIAIFGPKKHCNTFKTAWGENPGKQPVDPARVQSPVMAV